MSYYKYYCRVFNMTYSFFSFKNKLWFVSLVALAALASSQQSFAGNGKEKVGGPLKKRKTLS